MIFLWTFFEIAGTIAFAISGALVGISSRMDIFGILVLALSTAIGGGIIRDVLAQRIPSVLQEEIYALPSIIGGIVFYLIAIIGDDYWYLASPISFFVVFFLRMIGIYYHLSLPKVR